MNADPDGTNIVDSREEKDATSTPAHQPFGQAKYAVRGLGPSIYEDRTRNSADDDAACRVADTGTPALDNYRAQGRDDNS